MKDFFATWFLGFLACAIVLGGIVGIIVVIDFILTTLGAWSILLIIPTGFGLFVAIAEL